MLGTECYKCWCRVCECGEEWSVYKAWRKQDLIKLRTYLTELIQKKQNGE